MRRILLCILCFLTVTTGLPDGAKPVLEAVAAKLESTLEELPSQLQPGDSLSDWALLALGRNGLSGDYADSLNRLKDYVSRCYREKGGLDAFKATEWHRISLTVLALGGDPTAFGTDAAGNPIDLIADGCYNWSRSESLGAQGVNAWIYALLTLDAMDYTVPPDARFTREDILQALLAAQADDGSFGLSGGGDADLTAMALQAFVPYQDRADVRTATGRALDWLSQAQDAQGGFGAAEATAQVMIALCAMGLDPRGDTRFCKPGGSVVDALLRFQQESGLYAHEAGGTDNLFASVQAALAWTALMRMERGLRRLYDFRPEGVEGTHGGNGAVTRLYPEKNYVLPIFAGVGCIAVAAVWAIRRKK